MKTALYPGSFDPVTRGHLDVIARASRLCGTLIVAVMHNPDKRGAMDVKTRVRLLETACAPFANVKVIAHGGLLVDCARENAVDAVIRGVRPIGDFDSEYQMAQINRALGGVETLMMTTSEQLASISSSVVRQIVQFGGSIEAFVPDGMAEAIEKALTSRD